MRLIDADELKEDYHMADDCKDCKTNIRHCEYDRNYTKMDFCVWLDSAPTVDAVPVVRCKNCKFSEPINSMVIECTVWADARLKADFCSAGERKERDNDF